MAEWYYSLNGQQKGPVALQTLQQLASNGKIKSTDMVWREGLVDWQPASRVEGLFSRAEVGITARRRAEPGAAPAVEDATDDDRPRRKKKRKKQSSPGAMVAIIGSSVAGGLLVLIIIIVLLVRSGRGGNNPQGAAGNPVAGGQPLVYTVTLRQDQDNTRVMTFQQGQTIDILVRTPQGFLRNPDVDLFVSRTGDPGFFLEDIDISKDCHLGFVAPATDMYSIQVDNLGPGSATSTVTITVR